MDSRIIAHKAVTNVCFWKLVLQFWHLSITGRQGSEMLLHTYGRTYDKYLTYSSCWCRYPEQLGPV